MQNLIFKANYAFFLVIILTTNAHVAFDEGSAILPVTVVRVQATLTSPGGKQANGHAVVTRG